MSSRRTSIREALGVRLEKVELMNNGTAVDTSYVLYRPDQPVPSIYYARPEADQAYLDALAQRS